VLFVFTLGILSSGCAKLTRQKRGLTLEEGALSVGVEIGYPSMEYYAADGKTLISI
jgi:hypothetical protein